jgi:hypothetical protein
MKGKNSKLDHRLQALRYLLDLVPVLLSQLPDKRDNMEQPQISKLMRVPSRLPEFKFFAPLRRMIFAVTFILTSAL